MEMEVKTNKKGRNWVFALLCALLIVNTVAASRVAVVVGLSDQAYTKCVTVPQNTDAYQILEETSLNVVWSYYGQSLGHGLCGINGTGCPETNCYCDPNEYWNFYTKQNLNDPWTYSMVGFDGGSTCNDHYCAVDGGMLGLAYGVYGTQPASYSFNDVCCSMPGDYAPCGAITLSELLEYINRWAGGQVEMEDVLALINAWAKG